MFTLHIDMHIYYVPPMNESGPGIVLTHQVELPFVPSSDQAIFVPAIDRHSQPLGFCLKDVVYDAGRAVFLANTYAVNQDFPIAFIPEELADWLKLGWKFGSYLDTYAEEQDEDATDDEPSPEGPDEWEIAEGDRFRSWRNRDAATNRVFRAMIRHLVDAMVDEEDAYAFDITGRYFTTKELQEKQVDSTQGKKFWAARNAYIKMAEAGRTKWRQRVMRYPTIERVTRRMLKELEQSGGGPKTRFHAVP